jgi:hypothetical protein
VAESVVNPLTIPPNFRAFEEALNSSNGHN